VLPFAPSVIWHEYQTGLPFWSNTHNPRIMKDSLWTINVPEPSSPSGTQASVYSVALALNAVMHSHVATMMFRSI